MTPSHPRRLPRRLGALALALSLATAAHGWPVGSGPGGNRTNCPNTPLHGQGLMAAVLPGDGGGALLPDRVPLLPGQTQRTLGTGIADDPNLDDLLVTSTELPFSFSVGLSGVVKGRLVQEVSVSKNYPTCPSCYLKHWLQLDKGSNLRICALRIRNFDSPAGTPVYADFRNDLLPTGRPSRTVSRSPNRGRVIEFKFAPRCLAARETTRVLFLDTQARQVDTFGQVDLVTETGEVLALPDWIFTPVAP